MIEGNEFSYADEVIQADLDGDKVLRSQERRKVRVWGGEGVRITKREW